MAVTVAAKYKMNKDIKKCFCENTFIVDCGESDWHSYFWSSGEKEELCKNGIGCGFWFGDRLYG